MREVSTWARATVDHTAVMPVVSRFKFALGRQNRTELGRDQGSDFRHGENLLGVLTRTRFRRHVRAHGRVNFRVRFVELIFFVRIDDARDRQRPLAAHLVLYIYKYLYL